MSNHEHKHNDQESANQAPSESPAPVETTEGGGAAEEKFAALTAERNDLMGRLQRVSADFLNYQKRVSREVDEARQYGNSELAKAFIGVLDDLERAIEHSRANHPQDDPLMIGTELVFKKALDVLKRFGIDTVPTVGKMFDPTVHEALMQQPNADVPPLTILSEVQRGYTIKGRLLRPATVIVAAAEGEPGVSASQPSEEEEY